MKEHELDSLSVTLDLPITEFFESYALIGFIEGEPFALVNHGDRVDLKDLVLQTAEEI